MKENIGKKNKIILAPIFCSLITIKLEINQNRSHSFHETYKKHVFVEKNNFLFIDFSVTFFLFSIFFLLFKMPMWDIYIKASTMYDSFCLLMGHWMHNLIISYLKYHPPMLDNQSKRPSINDITHLEGRGDLPKGDVTP